MSFVKPFEDIAGMMSMNTNLQGVLGFRVVFDIYSLFIVDIWNDVQKGSGSIMISMSFQKVSAYPASSDLVDLCTNIWCNHSKETLFLWIFFYDFDCFFIFTKNACFLCAMYGNVTVLCSLSLKKNAQNHLWKSQVCPKFNNIIIENSRSHKYGANSTLYNVSMKGFLLLSHILFELILFVFMWQNSHLQLKYIYLFPPMKQV